jgi:NADH dehydrogenase
MRGDGPLVAVFGGTGFLGRHVVQHLVGRRAAVRIAVRHPEHGKEIFSDQLSGLEFVRADVCDDASITAAVAGAFGVVNAVSLYMERGNRTFHSVHVEAAARVATLARAAGVARLVHVSGIGANARSRSPYIRSRGEGEDAVRAAFGAATIIRPAVMFGPDDTFLIPLTNLLRRFHVLPIFGNGQTALQPAFVEDVGEAIARAFDADRAEAVYELGGPRVYTYNCLLRAIGNHLRIRPVLIPVPFGIWQALASVAEMLAQAPISRSQVELMRIDNIASQNLPSFEAFAIEPHGIEVVLAAS